MSPSLLSRALWRVMRKPLRRLGTILDWRPLDKALLLVGMLFFTALLYSASLITFPHTELASYLNPLYMKISGTICAVAVVMLTGMMVAGFRFHRKRRSWPAFSHLLAQFFMALTIWSSYVAGLYTSVGIMLLLTGLALSLPLLEREAINYAFATGFTAMTVVIVADLFGVIPYAPLFIKPPLHPDGTPITAWRTSQIVIMMITISVVWVVVSTLIARWREREAMFRTLSMVDELTHLANRRRFFDAFEGECLRARRRGQPLSLLMCDADHFKKVNDTYGHKTGDEVLIALAQILEESTRQKIDLAARIGGEEFVLLLPETDLKAATHVAERVAEKVRGLRFLHEGSSFSITLSIGVASMNGEQADAEILLEAADSLLYRAKRGGRDQVVASTVEELARSAGARPDMPQA